MSTGESWEVLCSACRYASWVSCLGLDGKLKMILRVGMKRAARKGWGRNKPPCCEEQRERKIERLGHFQRGKMSEKNRSSPSCLYVGCFSYIYHLAFMELVFLLYLLCVFVDWAWWSAYCCVIERSVFKVCSVCVE